MTTSVRKHTRTHTLATIISRIIDPPIIMILLSLVGISLSRLTYQGYLLLVFLLPVFIGLPLGFFLWSLKTRQVSNWDITNRKERIVPLMILLVFLALDIAIVTLLENRFLITMFLLYFIWNAGFLLITTKWKISGHTGVATLAVGLLIIWFGSHYAALFALVPLVAWARLVRNDHTLMQVMLGVIYSVVVLAIWFSWVY